MRFVFSLISFIFLCYANVLGPSVVIRLVLLAKPSFIFFHLVMAVGNLLRKAVVLYGYREASGIRISVRIEALLKANICGCSSLR